MVKKSQDPKECVYLLYGKEEFLKREFIQKLRREIFPSSQSSTMGFEQYEAPEHSVDAPIDFLRNASFFASQKLAVFYGLDELEAEDRQKLTDLIENFPVSSTLVLVSRESSIKKVAFLKALGAKTCPVACHLPFDKDLPSWVESRMKKLGKTIEKEAANLLIERIGKDAALLDSAIEQLAVYVNQEPRILVRHAETLLGRSVQADAFRLVDCLLEKKLKSALENLESLIREGARIYEIVGALSGQIDRLSRARTLMDEGFPSDAISSELKLHPYFAGRILEQAQKSSKRFFQSVLRDLWECDEAVKTGKLHDQLALQRFFLKVCCS